MTLSYTTQAQMARSLADMLSTEIQKAIQIRGACHMVFPGGNSPRPVLSYLQKRSIDWSLLYLYPSDERCVPVNDPERNDMLIEDFFFNKVPLPAENLRRMPAELGPDEGARKYNELLCTVPRFDIALLGMGPDGHTASLFPGNEALLLNEEAVPVFNAPKIPAERISLSVSRLTNSRERWFIVNDSQKKHIMDQVIKGEDFPIGRIQPTAWFVSVPEIV